MFDPCCGGDRTGVEVVFTFDGSYVFGVAWVEFAVARDEAKDDRVAAWFDAG